MPRWANKGPIVRLRFDAILHGCSPSSTSRPRSATCSRTPDAESEGIEYHYGVDFHELGAEDRMKIKSLVYQTIIEQPRRII